MGKESRKKGRSVVVVAEGRWGQQSTVSFRFIPLVILDIFVCSGSVKEGSHYQCVESKARSDVGSGLLTLMKLG